MSILLKKEWKAVLYSPVSLFFILAFLITCGLMNWFFPGSFNILDNGYANLTKFFELASIAFLLFIPALTMRSFSEEKRAGTLDVFRSYPRTLSSLFVGKLLALCSVVLITLLASCCYVYAVYILSVPVGNVDIHEIIASYFSLFLLSLVFITVGLFSSSLTKNQIVAFLTALFLNFVAFYGLEMFGSLFSSGKVQLFFSSIGLLSHYKLMGKGVMELDGLLTFFNYVVFFSLLTVYILRLKNKRTRIHLGSSLAVLLIINFVFLLIPDYRWDFTADKRYTLDEYSKNLLKKVADEKEKIHFEVYLDGDLNTGFQRLQYAVEDLLSDLKRYSDNEISYRFTNPYSMANTPEEVYRRMWEQHMQGIVLNETDREGRMSQKIIYPYAQAVSGKDTLRINLLKSVAGYTAEENLNASVENLEFEFIDALRLFMKKEPEAIAFIEGHGEIERPYVYDAEELLSKYYFVNRGEILNDISVLNEFKVVIIAGPTERFTEREKFIIDQYVMSGGRVLWLVDGVYLSPDELRDKSETPVIKNETNLDNLLFTYGIRINPVLLQDAQSTQILLSTGNQGAENYIRMPWYYSMLLMPSLSHPVTKDISLVKAAYGSSIDFVNQSAEVKKEVLLTTSIHSHSMPVPEIINFDISTVQDDPDYFNQSFLPVSVALEGNFNSGYVNRIIPDSIDMHSRQPIEKSVKTKMIVASASDIIRNELTGSNNMTQALPMGYDRVSDKQYGNRDFMVNAVNWLASEDDWISLRTKQQKIRLLDRQAAYTERNKYAVINIVLPVLLVIVLIGGLSYYRKRKYER